MHAVAEGELAVLEVAEELVPFGVGRGSVFLAGAGSRSRVRASIRALVRRTCFLYWMSLPRMGQGTAHAPQRAVSSSAHRARSR